MLPASRFCKLPSRYVVADASVIESGGVELTTARMTGMAINSRIASLVYRDATTVNFSDLAYS